MLDGTTIGVSVDRDADDLYEMLWQPRSFPRWASGLADASLRWDGAGWTANGPGGPVRIRFTERNDFGVMDHWVRSGRETVYVPLRIVRNGRGSEVLLTLFRQPAASDQHFAADCEWVRRDLAALKSLAEDGR